MYTCSKIHLDYKIAKMYHSCSRFTTLQTGRSIISDVGERNEQKGLRRQSSSDKSDVGNNRRRLIYIIAGFASGRRHGLQTRVCP